MDFDTSFIKIGWKMVKLESRMSDDFRDIKLSNGAYEAIFSFMNIGFSWVQRT